MLHVFQRWKKKIWNQTLGFSATRPPGETNSRQFTRCEQFLASIYSDVMYAPKISSCPWILGQELLNFENWVVLDLAKQMRIGKGNTHLGVTLKRLRNCIIMYFTISIITHVDSICNFSIKTLHFFFFTSVLKIQTLHKKL